MFQRVSGGQTRLRHAVVVVCLLAPLGLPIAAVAQSEQPHQRGSGPSRGAWLVEFRPDVDDVLAAQLIAGVGGSQIGSLRDLGVRVVTVPPGRKQDIAALARDPRVVSVQEDFTAEASLVPTDPRWSRQWGMRKIRAPEAWDRTVGRSKAVLAIVDTGIDRNQPDLRGRVLAGWDFQNNDSNPADDHGHGTAVAGVAAAAGNDGVGIAGLCWGCRILPVKVLNANGSGSHSNIAAGIVWATDHGADVINLSIAGPNSTNVVASSIEYARRRGVVVVGAAGNSGTTRKFYPAAYPGVLSVGATDGRDRLYSWSNRGSWVKLAAPGCTYTTKPRRSWSLWCGTSFATPAVAGTAALIKSLRPQMPRADVERILLRTAVSVSRVSRGRIDAARALRGASNWSPPAEPDPTPDPTPSPTPTPTPAPPSEPVTMTVVEWRGDLGPADRSDAKSFSLAGNVAIDLRWNADDHLWISVANSAGKVLAHEDDDEAIHLRVDLAPGTYRITVGHYDDPRNWYSVRIEHSG